MSVVYSKRQQMPSELVNYLENTPGLLYLCSLNCASFLQSPTHMLKWLVKTGYWSERADSNVGVIAHTYFGIPQRSFPKLKYA